MNKYVPIASFIFLHVGLFNPPGVLAGSDELAFTKKLCTFDALSFSTGDGVHAYVELFCHIPTSNLQFVKTQDGFRAGYRVLLSIYDLSGLQISSKNYIDSIEVETFSKIDQERSAKSVLFTFLLKPGQYKSVMTLHDLETFRTVTIRKDLSVPDYHAPQICASDLQIAQSIQPTEQTNLLTKFQWDVLPNITRIVGLENASVNVYCEIYNLPDSCTKPNSRFSAAYSIRDQKGRELKSAEAASQSWHQSFGLVGRLSVLGLECGVYELALIVLDEKGRILLTKSTGFLVINPDTAARTYAQLIRKTYGEKSVF